MQAFILSLHTPLTCESGQNCFSSEFGHVAYQTKAKEV